MSDTPPILIDLPMPIQTKRLTIRPLMPGDGKILFDAVEESREQFKLWLPWVSRTEKWQDSEQTSREFYADFVRRKALHLALFAEGKLIGMCGFNSVDWKIPSGAIGYWCRLSAQGQGYIQEAVSAITRYGFEVMGLKRITILCDDENIKSINVATSLGFDLETRAKGLIENLRGEGLVYGRRYVRFDTKGLPL